MSMHATLSNSRTEHPVARKNLHKLYNLKLLGKGVELCWVPSHVGIFGNERADKLSSDGAKQQESAIPIDYIDFFNHLRIDMNQIRSRKSQQSNQKLRQTKA